MTAVITVATTTQTMTMTTICSNTKPTETKRASQSVNLAFQTCVLHACARDTTIDAESFLLAINKPLFQRHISFDELRMYVHQRFCVTQRKHHGIVFVEHVKDGVSAWQVVIRPMDYNRSVFQLLQAAPDDGSITLNVLYEWVHNPMSVQDMNDCTLCSHRPPADHASRLTSTQRVMQFSKQMMDTRLYLLQFLQQQQQQQQQQQIIHQHYENEVLSAIAKRLQKAADDERLLKDHREMFELPFMFLVTVLKLLKRITNSVEWKCTTKQMVLSISSKEEERAVASLTTENSQLFQWNSKKKVVQLLCCDKKQYEVCYESYKAKKEQLIALSPCPAMLNLLL